MVMYALPSCSAHLGFNPPDLQGIDFMDLVDPADHQAASTFLQGPVDQSAMVRLRVKDRADVVPFQMHRRLVSWGDGFILATGRAHRPCRPIRSLGKLSTGKLFNNKLTLSAEYMVVDPNFATAIGRKREDMMGKSLYEFMVGDDITHVAHLHRQIVNMEPREYMITGRLLHSNGNVVWVSTFASFSIDQDTGKPTAVCTRTWLADEPVPNFGGETFRIVPITGPATSPLALQATWQPQALNSWSSGHSQGYASSALPIEPRNSTPQFERRRFSMPEFSSHTKEEPMQSHASMMSPMEVGNVARPDPDMLLRQLLEQRMDRTIPLPPNIYPRRPGPMGMDHYDDRNAPPEQQPRLGLSDLGDVDVDQYLTIMEQALNTGTVNPWSDT
eukprot:comp20081_c0_seq2/m.24724 comp20081_c0_seq2/g.24724  ORF comp20081_c0_seq2/g.24724 comp20081_c0_seq2/m.24724 type:complete len:387 (-) comp20081_c0_seq2:30-1190(-)